MGSLLNNIYCHMNYVIQISKQRYNKKMQDIDKLQSLRKSGRFQCDLFFYTKLVDLLTHLNLYQYLAPIKKNQQIIERTAELTKKHLIALEEEDDEQKAYTIIKQINKEVTQLNTKCVQPIFQVIDKMGGKSFEEKVIAWVKGQPCKKLYADVFDKISNNVHDPALRLNDMIVVAMFISKNGDKIDRFVQIYGVVIQNGIQELKKFRQNYDFIEKNPQIADHPKVKAYLEGSHIVITILLKFNQIYKLLGGGNKFGIKLNAIKKDIERILHKQQDPHKLGQSHSHFHEEAVAEFKKFLLTGENMPQLCSLSLCLGQDDPQCRNVIKLLYKKKQGEEENKQ